MIRLSKNRNANIAWLIIRQVVSKYHSYFLQIKDLYAKLMEVKQTDLCQDECALEAKLGDCEKCINTHFPKFFTCWDTCTTVQCEREDTIVKCATCYAICLTLLA